MSEPIDSGTGISVRADANVDAPSAVNAEVASPVEAEVKPNEPARGMWISLTGLLLSVLALGLATIPAMAMERPLPNPFAEEKPEQEVEAMKPPAERDGGMTVKYK